MTNLIIAIVEVLFGAVLFVVVSLALRSGQWKIAHIALVLGLAVMLGLQIVQAFLSSTTQLSQWGFLAVGGAFLIAAIIALWKEYGVRNGTTS